MKQAILPFCFRILLCRGMGKRWLGLMPVMSLMQTG
jgi:hypothetical protein